MSKVDSLLSRLDKVRPSGGDSWMACCPSHDDRSPSLSIRDTGDKVLLHCFAGCPAQDVLDALDMSWGDLYPDPWQASFAAACAYKGRKFRPLKPLDPMELERTIIDLGKADIEAGLSLSFEDKARMKLALERIKEVA